MGPASCGEAGGVATPFEVPAGGVAAGEGAGGALWVAVAPLEVVGTFQGAVQGTQDYRAEDGLGCITSGGGGGVINYRYEEVLKY